MSGPQVRIVEQPAEKSFRFRYESEGRLNGSLFGEKNTSKKVSYPKIEISNFTGTAVIIVSCVTNDKNGAYKFVIDFLRFICEFIGVSIDFQIIFFFKQTTSAQIIVQK